jgi:nitrate reductase NapD
MNISSVIVRARPEKLPALRLGMAQIPGVEVHAATADGHLIVTIEDRPGFSTADAFVKLHNLDGVIAASLVYQYCDDGTGQEASP